LIKFSHWFIDRIEKIFNHTHSREQVKDFVIRKFNWAFDCVAKMAEPKKAEIAYDLWQIYEKMFALGWVNIKKNSINAYCSKKQISTAEYLAWKRDLWDGKVIRAGVIKAGAGFYLDQSVLNKKYYQASFVLENLESLLKNVETKRERCLQNFEPTPDANSIWFERLDIDLLFVRTARREKDPRFLNAALKLNDWYFSYIQRKATLPELVRFLLALVEQELVFKELYP
jgi:hypothetical protein